MKKVIRTLFLGVLFLHFNISSSYSEENKVGTEWNQFRGHDRSGIVTNTNHPEKWDEDGLTLLWKIETGDSFSEVAVSNGRAYVMTSEQTDSVSGYEQILALDAATGEKIWKQTISSLFIDEDEWGHGSRSTPVIDKTKVYTFSGTGKLTALSIETGEIIWQRDFISEFGSELPRWGYSSSPLLVENGVVMEIGGTDNRALGMFCKDTGELIWAKGEGPAGYISPVPAIINGQKSILYINGETLYSFDTKGNILWTCEVPVPGPMAVPVVIEHNRIFISAIRRIGYCIIEVNDNEPEIILTGTNMKNDYSSSVYHNGYIYGFNIAALVCIDATTGERKWVRRGFGKGSLIIIEDKLVIFSDTGTLVYAHATPEGFQEISSFEALDGRCWTAPSYTDGRLYVRNLTHVACYSFKN